MSDYLGTPKYMYNSQGELVWHGTLDIYGRITVKKVISMTALLGIKGNMEIEKQVDCTITVLGIMILRWGCISAKILLSF
ncbi:RHS domain-containing protein [Myroides odoratimimus]|uniref:RHS domain-containing protein n=1 Tax=Myroides odoratimimus TaxID=76832 RepID=UPI002575FAF5|nr:RHS domain-containing protein [Myroides odoratimimus]